MNEGNKNNKRLRDKLAGKVYAGSWWKSDTSEAPSGHATD
jgi:hypothetical protein